MADLSNISLSSNVGDISHGNSGNYYQKDQGEKKKEKQPSKLRAGEIVRGTISERLSNQTANVRIPTGTFKAIVSENLRKGDSLFFKVIETTPNLTLRVYEVHTSYNNELVSTQDLIRVLDLPDMKLYHLMLDKMRQTRKTILREDALEIYKLASKGENEFLSKTDITSLINQLNEMQKAKLPLSINLINKLIPLFVDENIISKYLNILASNLDKIDKKYKDRLTEIFNDIKNNNYKKNNLFVLKISDDESDPSFFDILMEISEGDYSIELLQSASGIRDLIAAMSLWNIISFSGKTPFHYIIPYYFSNEYYVIRIVKQTMNKVGNSPIMFTFSMPTQTFGDIRTKVLGFQNQLKVYLEAESDKIVEVLEQFRESLEKAISQKGFRLENLKIGLEDISSELSEISNSNSGDHFTIVV